MPGCMVRFLFVASAAVCCARAGKRTLPSVDSMLTKANSKAHDFAQQAAAMQQKLAEQQAKSRRALDKQKEEYEQLLQAQSNQSRAIKTKIDELQSGNSKLSQMNTEMVTDLQTLAGKNRELRDALQDITSKVSAAQLFLADSLKVTDDSTAKELEVLSPTTPKPTVDSFLAMTSSGKMTVLVQTSRIDGGPEELVSMLAGSLSDIAAAEQEGAADLKSRFMQSFNEGEKQQAELNETVAALERTQSSLKEYRAKLLDAKAHLEATNTNLHERLRAVRAFVTTVEGVVGASLPVGETKTANAAIVKTDFSAAAVAPAMVPAPTKTTQVSVAAKQTQAVAAKPTQAPVKKMLRTAKSAHETAHKK